MLTSPIFDWLIFNVVVPLLAVPLVWLGLWLIGKAKPLMFIIRDGQLCFFCAVTISLFIRDVIQDGRPAIGFVLATAFVLIFSMFVYGVAVINSEFNGHQNSGKIGATSIFLAVTTVSLVVWGRGSYGML